MSHSHVEEWISGSFIQSHWPCMTLWPISMFSRILARPSEIALAASIGRRTFASSGELTIMPIRAAAAIQRWVVITRLM